MAEEQVAVAPPQAPIVITELPLDVIGAILAAIGAHRALLDQGMRALVAAGNAKTAELRAAAQGTNSANDGPTDTQA